MKPTVKKEQTEGKSDAADDLKQCIAAGAKDFNRLPKAVSGEVLALPYLRLKLVNALTVSIRKIHIKPFFAEYGLHIGIKSGFLRFAPMLQNRIEQHYPGGRAERQQNPIAECGRVSAACKLIQQLS